MHVLCHTEFLIILSRSFCAALFVVGWQEIEQKRKLNEKNFKKKRTDMRWKFGVRSCWGF